MSVLWFGKAISVFLFSLFVCFKAQPYDLFDSSDVKVLKWTEMRPSTGVQDELQVGGGELYVREQLSAFVL